MVILENNTPFPYTCYVLNEPATGAAYGSEKWRCIIGNKDDRGRQLPVYTADGLLVPGKTTPIENGKPRPPEEWRGILPSPIVEFTNAEWTELEQSPSYPILAALIEAGDITKRRQAG